jgi:hypothetical protein
VGHQQRLRATIWVARKEQQRPQLFITQLRHRTPVTVSGGFAYALVATCLPKQLRQPRDVDSDPARLVCGEYLGLPGIVGVVARIVMGQRLLTVQLPRLRSHLHQHPGGLVTVIAVGRVADGRTA